MGKTGQAKTGKSPTGDAAVLSVSGTASVTSTTSGTVTGTTSVEGSASVVSTTSGFISGATTSVAGTASAVSTTSGVISTDTTGTASVVSTTSGLVSDATAAVDLGIKWQVIRDQTHTETGVFDVQITDTANPFGNFAIAKIDDIEGSKFDDYTRGTRVDFNYSLNGGISYTNRFTGYVVEARELDDQGADALEVECYSFDQFLRRDSVTNDQTGNTISEALEDIITEDTPVDWNASLVAVEDDQELTQSYRGDKVENVLQNLASKSSNEDFGVADDLEFFFRPRESSQAPRDIDNSQWFNYDIPEEGKRTINEVTVYFDEGNESVTVDDGSDKKDLQESIGTSDPVTFAEEVSRPEITNVEDARAVAEEILDGKETTLTGTVTTYGLVTAEPGDVINIEITPRGISGDFRIAEIEYRWGEANTIITVVEKRGDQDDLLVNLSDTLKRVELGDVDRDAPNTRVTSTYLEMEIETSGDVDGVDFDSSRFTNVGLNRLRDVWATSETLDITQIAVGNDGSEANREQTDLGNELERVSVSDTVVDATTVDFDGTFSTSDVREVGLFTSDDDMVARATLPSSSLSGTPTATIRVTVNNGNGNGVVTNEGQALGRQTIDGSSASWATRYAYGTDGTEPEESDEELGNQLVSEELDDIVIQSAFSTSDFEDIVSVPSDEPIGIQNNQIELLQCCWFAEAEDSNFVGSSELFAGDFSNNSGGDNGVRLELQGDIITFEFTPEYTIPSGEPQVAAFAALNDFDGTAAMFLNGSRVADATYSGTTTDNGIRLSSPFIDQRLEAGETYEVRIEITQKSGGEPESGSFDVDFFFLYDNGNRFGWTNINTNPTYDSGSESYNGPELYPQSYQLVFDAAITRRVVTEASLDQTWNDTTNNQEIAVSNDGGNTWKTASNTDNSSFTFDSAETDVQARITLSRYQANSTTTPSSGDGGQNVSQHVLRANPDAVTASDVATLSVRSIVSPNVLSTGTTLREAGQATGPSDVVTRSTFAEFDVQADQTIQSAETLVFKNPE